MPNPISIDEFVNRATETPQTKSTGGASSAISIDDFVSKSVQTKPKQAKPKKDALQVATDIATTIFPTKNIGEAIGTEIAKNQAAPGTKQYVAPSTATKGGIAGDVIQNALFFTPIGSAARGAAAGIRAVAPTLGAKTVQTAANIGTGAAVGYGADIGMGMSAGEENPFTPGIGTAIGAVVPAVASRIGAKTAEQIAAEKAKTVGRIVPGNEKQVETATRAFQNVKTGGAKTYKDLSGVLDNEIKAELAKVDSAFARNPVPQPTSAFSRIIRTDDGKIGRRANYVNDGIAQLQKYYKATRDLQGSAEINQLARKAKSVGLTPDEINKLARRHGSALNAYKKNGEVMAGLNKQAFENTRRGLKDTARSFLPDKAAQAADKKASDLIKTKELVDKMADSVYRLENRIQDPGVMGKAGEAAGLAVDVVTGGLLRAFLSTILRNSNIRKKTLDSVDLQKQLEKNLKVLEKLEKSPNGEIQKFLQSLQDGDKQLFPGDVLIGKEGRKATEDYISNYIQKPRLGLQLEDVSKKARGGVPNTPAFTGFKDLTTKVLEKLKGRSTVSKQFISDMTNSPDLKQVEKDVIRKVLDEVGDTVNVKDFANRVKAELLPLKKLSLGGAEDEMTGFGALKYENITLPDELRGPIYAYDERIYRSPIKTSAGKVHFGDADTGDYFAHSRVEDLAEGLDELGQPNAAGKTRRVIEIQSDLFQKGRLEGEKNLGNNRMAGLHDADDIIRGRLTPTEYESYQKMLTSSQKSHYLDQVEEGLSDKIKAEVSRLEKGLISAREKELAPLEPYRNTWWERIIREEVKQAAKDGKTKLQFPTGETAMKIEGLGESPMVWRDVTDEATKKWADLPELSPETLTVGKTIEQNNIPGQWIITDVLGDGKFKAVSKDTYQANSKYVDGSSRAIPENAKETFDISGKVDTENPIYKFYEKQVQKYLTNKYGGKVITDPQGVKWVEIDIDKKMKGLPVEAFGAGALPLTMPKEDKKLPQKPPKLSEVKR